MKRFFALILVALSLIPISPDIAPEDKLFFAPLSAGIGQKLRSGRPLFTPQEIGLIDLAIEVSLDVLSGSLKLSPSDFSHQDHVNLSRHLFTLNRLHQVFQNLRGF